MKKMIAVLLLLGLLAGICGPAAAEKNQDILDFPESGFTFVMPDCVKNLTGQIYSITDRGETGYGSGIIYANALYLPRTNEECDAMNAMLDSVPNPNEPSEEVRQAYAEFMAPRTELFIIVALAEGKTWEKDVLSLNDADILREPVKLGENGGFTYYLTAIKPEAARSSMEKVSQERQDELIDATDQIMEHPELFTLKERDLSQQAPEPGTQIDFETQDLDGNTVTRADLTAGSKVTVITFWQTFCGPCKEEMPELDRLVREYGDKGLNVVGCVCDAGTESTLELAKEIAGEHLFRNVKISKSMYEALPCKGTPASYFLDAEGRVLDYPVSSKLPADYIAALEAYLNGETDEFQALLLQKVKGGETAKQTDEEQTYTVRFVDQNGDPVPEVAAAFCTANGCNNVESDENGQCVFKGPADTYHITIVEVPDGYSEDYSDDVFTERHTCSITIVIEKK